MKVDYSILLHAMPFIFLLMAVEIFFLIKEEKFKLYGRNVIANIFMGIGSFGFSFFAKGTAFFLYSWVYEFRVFTIPVNTWWSWIICFLADDLCYYLCHRGCHNIRYFWASHSVHHSAEYFAPSVTLRLPWTGNISGSYIFWIWMPFIGIHPAMVIMMKSISVIYQFLIHTDKIDKLPKWVEAVFNTPAHHRVHHGSNPEYLDVNHGGTLIIWDRLFGTFKEETVKPEYGLTEKVNSNNPILIEFHEWKRMCKDFKKAKRFSDYLHFIFDSPGWSPDGTSKTVHQLRTELKNKSCDH